MAQLNDTNDELKQRWTEEQDDLKAKMIIDDGDNDASTVTLIGGVDISFVKDSDTSAVAALVILSYPQLEVVYEKYDRVELEYPYIPGFLAFREVPFLVALLEELKQKQPQFYPNVVMVDGNGVLHPRGFGLACHLGVLCDIPCLGVAKNLHCVDGLERDTVKQRAHAELKSAGEFFELRGDSGRVWGAALRSSEESINPIYISPGHRITLAAVVKLVQSCCKYRIPEPVRMADLKSRDVIREATAAAAEAD